MQQPRCTVTSLVTVACKDVNPVEEEEVRTRYSMYAKSASSDCSFTALSLAFPSTARPYCTQSVASLCHTKLVRGPRRCTSSGNAP